jgi:hypothetical protein
MTVEQGLRMIAGAFVVISVALGVWVSPWFLAFTAFVGLNLFQSAFSNWCPMMWVLRRAGMRDAAGGDRRAAGGAH